MARISIDKIPSGGGGYTKANYFALKADRERATVRLLYNDISDVAVESIHEVPSDTGTWNMKVGCLRNPGDPVDVCPLCASGNRPKYKIYIPLLNQTLDANGSPINEVQIWERSQKFAKELTALFERMDEPYWATPVEVTRYGQPRSTDTRYDLWANSRQYNPDEKIDLTAPNPHGSAIRDWSYDEMLSFVGGKGEDIERKRTPKL